MFIHGFPYTNYAEINLDWVIRKIIEQSKANGIEFDDTVTQINANNVQTAIEKLKELIDVFTEGTLKKIDNGINLDLWRDGYTFTHVQTVNNPTLLTIIDAVKNDNIIILKDSVSSGANNDFNYYYMIDIVEDTLNLVHKVSFLDFSTNKVHTIEIYAINDAENIYAVLLPDVTITYVNSFNGRTGVVVSLPGDYDASDIDYDNTVSGLTATDTQSAIDELNATKQNTLTFDATPTIGSNNPVTSDGIANAIPSIPVTSVFNRTGDVVATAGDYDASDIDYDNTGSGLSATDTQSAIDELKGDIPTTAIEIGYNNSGSGINATEVQRAIDELNSSTVQILNQTVTSLGSVIVNRMGILTIDTPSLCPDPGITLYGYICFGSASQKIIIATRFGNNDTWINCAPDGYTFNGWTQL